MLCLELALVALRSFESDLFEQIYDLLNKSLLEKKTKRTKQCLWKFEARPYLSHKGCTNYFLPTFVKVNNKYVKMIFEQGHV